jgi:hypothetical protein
MGALQAGFSTTRMREHFGDEELVSKPERALRIFRWPMLLIFEWTVGYSLPIVSTSTSGRGAS